MQLFTYFRSSAAFRVRIALNLKGAPHELVPVHMLRGGGEHLRAEYLALNPAGLVPVLQVGDVALTQSIAIIEYLDETLPRVRLLPATPAERARVRSLALSIACEIHPLNNLRVLNYLTGNLRVDDEGRRRWYAHWVETGLSALEAMLAGPGTGRYCHGDTPTLADCCLVPQVFNAQRFDCRLDHVPTVMAIHDRCMALDAFRRAAPAFQPDAETSRL
jgi:maleylacetoacetate isomerase